MPVPALVIPRAEFSIEDPWAVPPECTPFALRRATDGGAPRQATSVAVYRDETLLTIVFRCDDDEIVASMYGHDEPLWQEDVVEAFLAPADGTTYFEIELNPLGTTFDARIDSPGGVRETMRADLAWTCEGLFAAVRRAGLQSEYVLRMPFSAIGGRPARANFFRVDRNAKHGDEYSAWSPTMREPADFHVVAAFGVLEWTG
jgi:Carbohydrate-binding family 9